MDSEVSPAIRLQVLPRGSNRFLRITRFGSFFHHAPMVRGVWGLESGGGRCNKAE